MGSLMTCQLFPLIQHNFNVKRRLWSPSHPPTCAPFKFSTQQLLDNFTKLCNYQAQDSDWICQMQRIKTAHLKQL